MSPFFFDSEVFGMDRDQAAKRACANILRVELSFSRKVLVKRNNRIFNRHFAPIHFIPLSPTYRRIVPIKTKPTL